MGILLSVLALIFSVISICLRLRYKQEIKNTVKNAKVEDLDSQIDKCCMILKYCKLSESLCWCFILGSCINIICNLF